MWDSSVPFGPSDHAVDERSRTNGFEFIIGNPPYVPITGLLTGEKERFRRRFASAEGRFDLYLLFFEQALRLLNVNGRLVFITPENFLYVNTARSFRSILANYHVPEIEMLDESTFADLVTYPTVTTIDSMLIPAKTTVHLRDGSVRQITLPRDGPSLQPLIHAYEEPNKNGTTLSDICIRISCGIATGADSVFVRKNEVLDHDLARYSHPTISGRELSSEDFLPSPDKSMLTPYDRLGKLLPPAKLGVLGRYLSQPEVQQRLKARTCTAHKAWYAFHDSAPLPEILRPKLLCKDITSKPHF